MCTNSWATCPATLTNPIANAIGGVFGNNQTEKQAVAWRLRASSLRKKNPADKRIARFAARQAKTIYSLYGGLQDKGDLLGSRAIDEGGTDDGSLVYGETDNGFSIDIDTYDRSQARPPLVHGEKGPFPIDVDTYDRESETSSESDRSRSSSGGVHQDISPDEYDIDYKLTTHQGVGQY